MQEETKKMKSIAKKPKTTWYIHTMATAFYTAQR